MKNKLPERWKFLKVDLFDNASIEELKEGKRKFKLAFSVKTYEGSEWLYFRAAMNSPRKLYKRFVRDDWDWNHYNTVLKHHDALRYQEGVERINISKIYQKGFAESKHIVEGMSALLLQTADEYICRMYVVDYMMDLTLDTHNLTAKQRKQNIIASATLSNDNGYARKRATDFI